MSNHLTSNEKVQAVLEEFKAKVKAAFSVPVNVQVNIYIDTPDMGVEMLLQEMAHAMQLPASVFSTKCRRESWVSARGVAALLLRETYPDLSLVRIGEIMGGRDHATVINSIKRVRDLLSVGDSLVCGMYNIGLEVINKVVHNGKA